MIILTIIFYNKQAPNLGRYIKKRNPNSRFNENHTKFILRYRLTTIYYQEINRKTFISVNTGENYDLYFFAGMFVRDLSDLNEFDRFLVNDSANICKTFPTRDGDVLLSNTMPSEGNQ